MLPNYSYFQNSKYLITKRLAKNLEANAALEAHALAALLSTMFINDIGSPRNGQQKQ
jgi:hypothetical protein